MKSLIIISKIRRLYKPLAVGRDHFRASRDRLWRSAFGTLTAPAYPQKIKKDAVGPLCYNYQHNHMPSRRRRSGRRDLEGREGGRRR